ncbi:hypothetical protein FRC09_003869 [Ceratobasidium sp. 395]|nr:hypothetical protein FRC09_003869 [Ceratobasidium sp. 395]
MTIPIGEKSSRKTDYTSRGGDVIEKDSTLPRYLEPAPVSADHARNSIDTTWVTSPESEPGPSNSRRPSRPLPAIPGYGQLSLVDANPRVQSDGRLYVSFAKRFSKKLPDSYGAPMEEFRIDLTGFQDTPKMSVNIMIVGSRGDVQPYLALGQKLQQYGHTVRLATHETFQELVKGAGFESLKNGDIGKKQRMVVEILEGCFVSCFRPDDEQDGGATFAADAIISNPPMFAHIHCAEALGIPLLLSFNVVGFYFLDLAKGYTPLQDLERFLAAGEAPIYVGFGSIVLDDPQQITSKSVLAAIALCGVRAVISPGWGGLDKGMIESAGPNVFTLGNVPHDWLFERVSAVCHHGGAGTTAIGLRCGRPTIIVPFFGDQPWWASQIARRSAGPPPITPKQLTAESLAAAIQIALSPQTRNAAALVGDTIKQEDGTKNGLESFHRHLPLLNMRCELDPSRVAVLAECGEFDINDLELHRSREYDTHMAATDVVTGAISPFIKTINDIGRGLAKLPTTQPDKGVMQILGGYTLGGQAVLQGISEGLYNTPKLYGGEVREIRKAFAYGLYDGFADVIKEPTKQYKEKGIVGGMVGVAVGSTNLLFKPVAGALAAVSLPLEGTIKDVRSLFHKKTGTERHATRHRERIFASQSASPAEREVVFRAFKRCLVRAGSASPAGTT